MVASHMTDAGISDATTHLGLWPATRAHTHTHQAGL